MCRLVHVFGVCLRGVVFGAFFFPSRGSVSCGSFEGVGFACWGCDFAVLYCARSCLIGYLSLRCFVVR